MIMKKKTKFKNFGLGFHKPLSKIQDGLYLGDMVDAHDKENLKKLGIRYILNVTKECPIFHPDEFIYLRIDL